MYPHDIDPKLLKLPGGPREGIVLITGGVSLRYLRFGYRLQQEFPGMVRAWFARTSNSSKKFESKKGSIKETIKKYVRYMVKCLDNFYLGDVFGEVSMTEKELFAEEVCSLSSFAKVRPILVETPNDPKVVQAISDTNSYFLLTLGGPLLKKEVLGAVRGVAMNQHAGWSPEIRGAGSIKMALYFRRLDWIGSTVHLMDTGADSGDILRRSLTYISKDSTVSECFLRTVALGTEMMIEVVRDMICSDEVVCFPQPHVGQTFRASDVSRFHCYAIGRDLKHGWLAHALDVKKSF